jgi:hypothetical protein
VLVVGLGCCLLVFGRSFLFFFSGNLEFVNSPLEVCVTL